MRLSTRMALVLLFVPLIASAQFRDLDVALSNLNRGFASGDPQAVVAGIASSDKVMLQFPGLMQESGFFGRDQTAYLLDGLFGKVHPSGFELQSARKVTSEGQYHITATWTIQNGGKPETRELYITLRQTAAEGPWTVVSIRSAGK